MPWSIEPFGDRSLYSSTGWLRWSTIFCFLARKTEDMTYADVLFFLILAAAARSKKMGEQCRDRVTGVSDATTRRV